MNTANKITLTRIILIPIILILMLLGSQINNYGVVTTTINFPYNIKINILWIIAGILFIIAAISDWLDGYIARKYNQITNFGKIFDPIADKMLTTGVVIIMTVAQIIPLWVTLILILRDLLIDGLRIFASYQKIIISANIYGKLKTVFLMIGLIILFFINYQTFSFKNNWGSYQQHLTLVPLYLAVIFSLWSGIIYSMAISKKLH